MQSQCDETGRAARRGRLRIAAVLAWCLAIQASLGGTRTWTGGAGPFPTQGKWSLAANWSPAAAPQANDTLIFPKGVRNGNTTNDLGNLSLSGFICLEDVWIEGRPLTITDTITIRTNAHVVFNTKVTLGGVGGSTVQVRILTGRCEFYDELAMNGHVLLVTGGTDSRTLSSSASFTEVTGAGSFRVRADGDYESPLMAGWNGAMTAFTGSIHLERGRGGISELNGNWPGTVVVGTATNSIAEFTVHDEALATNALVEIYPDAAVTMIDAQVGEVRFHGGRLLGDVVVHGSLNQLNDAAAVAVGGDIVLMQPTQRVAAAGMSFTPGPKPAVDAPATTLFKTGPGTMSVHGTNGLRSAWTVLEGALRVTDPKGLGTTTATNTVASGATLWFDLDPVAALESVPQTVNEPVKLLGHGSVPSLLGSGRVSFNGPVLLGSDPIIRSEGEVALTGTVSGAARLRGEAAPEAWLKLLHGGKTYTGGTEMRAGLMIIPVASEIPSSNPTAGQLLVGATDGSEARVEITDAGSGSEIIAPVVRTGGTLVFKGNFARPKSLDLSGNARVRVEASELEIESRRIQVAAAPAGLAVITGTLQIKSLGDPDYTVDTPGPAVGAQLHGTLVNGDPGQSVTLIKTGAGQLVLSGTLDNDNYGDVVVRGGALVLNKTREAHAVRRDAIQVGPIPGDNASLVIQGPDQLDASVSVVVGPGGTLSVPQPRARGERVGSLTGSGLVVLGANAALDLITSGTNAFSGRIQGDGHLAKSGPGLVRLTGTNTHTGDTLVSGGRLQVDGRIASSPILVSGGAILGGTGVVAAVTVASNGLLSPGASPGRLTTGDLTLLPASRFRAELNGNGPGGGFDQLTVRGSVTVSNALLDLIPGFVPELGKTFRLIDNDGADAIAGGFLGTFEGMFLSRNPLNFSLSYAGGDSANDLVLETVSTNGLPPNRLPTLEAAPDRIVVEGSALRFQLVGADADGDETLTYSFLGPVPEGASLHPATGSFDWTPVEAQGPSTNSFTVQVADSAQPPGTATRTFTVFVLETNSVPHLEDISDETVSEGLELSLKASASDSDWPAQTLVYSLVGSPPAGLTLNTNTGRLRWTPTEAQGPSTNAITVRVTDDGVPAKSTNITFTVIVNEVNDRPALTAPADVTIAEDGILSVSATATDADLPAQTLSYSLAGTPPPGLAIHPASGLLTWPPGETDGPSTNLIRVRVTDNGSPARSDTEEFRIVVTEKNEKPVLSPVADREVPADSDLALTLQASDSDRPGQTLVFGFVGSPPSGMTLNTNTGRLLWSPAPGQRPSTNTVTVRVTDDGSPPKSDAQTFIVRALSTATPPPAPVIESINRMGNGQFRLEGIGATNVPILIEASTNLTGWESIANRAMTDGTFQYIQTNPASHVIRFYRARAQ